MKDAATSSETPDYALVTAAYNERQHIVNTLESVVAQTVVPTKWVIVSDGSSDGTDDVVREYAASYGFIELQRRERCHSYNYASKVHALDIGFTRVLQFPVQFIGNVDADVSFSRSYFAEVMNRFGQNPTLGIAGGAIYERHGTTYRPRPGNRVSSVAGAVQMFRRECYQSIGGFLPLRYGGEDWCTQVMARMKGWRVETFTDLEVCHHRPIGGPAGMSHVGFAGGPRR